MRRLWALGARVGLLALLASLVYVFWPSSLGGCSTMTIVSGHSMEPTYLTGDLVWSRCGEPAVGDVVVYTPPGNEGARVIHRIIGGNGEDGWILQGDNNDFVDPWNPDNSHVVGIATVHIPHLGNVMYALGNPYVWGSLLLLAAAIVVWPSPRAPESVEDPEGAEDPEQPEDSEGTGASPDSTPDTTPDTRSEVATDVATDTTPTPVRTDAEGALP